MADSGQVQTWRWWVWPGHGFWMAHQYQQVLWSQNICQNEDGLRQWGPGQWGHLPGDTRKRYVDQLANMEHGLVQLHLLVPTTQG